MAKSFEISRVIKSDILAGRVGSAGDRFMTIRELMKRHSVSLVTAKKIIDILKDDGLLVSDSTNPAIINPELEELFATNQAAAADKRIGLVVTNLGSPFFSELAGEVERVGQQAGYSVLTASSDYDYEREKNVISEFVNLGITKLLITPGLDERSADLYNDLLRLGVRLVFLARRINGIAADSVVAHNFQGAQDIAEHFLEMGYESYGYIGRSEILQNDPRLNGFQFILEKNGKKLLRKFIAQSTGWGIEDGFNAMAKLASQPHPPRAIFAYNDLLAIGALQYCRENSIDVPGQIAIAGFDNLSESIVANLTSVAYPVSSMAEIAVQTICSNPQTSLNPEPHNILLQPKLVIRKSSDSKANSVETEFHDQHMAYQEI